MIINRGNMLDLFRGYQLVFQGAWQQAPSMADMVATEVPSSGSEEHYAWLGTMPRFREWIGDRQIQSLAAHDFTIKNKTFENSIGVKREHIEDDKYGLYNPMIQQLGMEAKTHPDELVFAGLALNGASQKCYDGQNYFDTSHPVLAADGSTTTVSNYGGGAGAPWYLMCTSRPIKPFIKQVRRAYNFQGMTSLDDEGVFMRNEYRYGVDARLNVGYGLWQLAYMSKQTLDITSYAAARAGMLSLKGNGGKVLAITPETLLVHPSLEKQAQDIVAAQRLANGQDNTMYGTAKVIVCPWLA
jgi:phage major head subunit gpT-like protein